MTDDSTKNALMPTIDPQIIEQLQSARIDWDSWVESPYIFAAVFAGKPICLRLNDFSAEPICTLIVDGKETELFIFGFSFSRNTSGSRKA